MDLAAFRAAQARTNQQLLDESGVSQAVADVAVSSSKPSSTGSAKAPTKKKATTKKRKAEVEADDAPVTRRRSTRTATVVASVQDKEEQERLRLKAAEEEEARLAKEKEEMNRRKHGDRTIKAGGGVTDAGDEETLLTTLKEIAELSIDEPEEKWEKGKKPKADTRKLESESRDMGLRAIVKTIPDRIYSLAIHPSTDRDLVFAGDKTGHLSLWDCTDAGKDLPSVTNGSIRNGAGGADGDEDGAEEVETKQWGKWWVWQGHLQNSVSCLKFRPGDSKSIYSASYDGTLRVHDFEKGVSSEVIDGDRWTDEALLHSFDFDATGNEIWVSDNNGGLIFRDLREPKESAKRWDIDGYKVGCVSLNPANPSMAATSHLKRYMRLWDLSVLRSLPEDTPLSDILEGDNSPLLAYHSHEKAVSSAYFDPSGTRLASTSYDDAIRIWDIDPKKTSGYAEDQKWKPASLTAHNCQVGRYVTVLRAHWSPSPQLPPHLFIGDMIRGVNLYSADGTRVKVFQDDSITAVPAVTAAHPVRGGFYAGGSASGKISLLTYPRDGEGDEE
ncbi:hypothetical protein JCM8547_007108 [Rhodosporidiobolus lusitaniae]